MKTDNSTPSSAATTVASKPDRTKLVSLLALAGGAVAMPQTGNADIIFQPENATVGYGSGDQSSYVLNLPGSTLAFNAIRSTFFRSATGLYSTWYRPLVVGWAAGASAAVQGIGGLAAARDKDAAWSAGLNQYLSAPVARSTFYRYLGSTIFSSTRAPASSYDHKYLAFRFNGSGTNRLYGWIDVSLQVDGGAGVGYGPRLTISGYAYDDSGAQLNMGQIPEPGAMSILALGALAFGARGLRSWRRQRDNVPPA